MTYLSTSTVRLSCYGGAPCSASSCVQGLGAPRLRGTWELLPSCLTLAPHLAPVGHRGTREGDFEGPGSCTRGPNWVLGRFSWPWGGGFGGRSARAPPPPPLPPPHLSTPAGGRVRLDPGSGSPSRAPPEDLGTSRQARGRFRRPGEWYEGTQRRAGTLYLVQGRWFGGSLCPRPPSPPPLPPPPPPPHACIPLWGWGYCWTLSSAPHPRAHPHTGEISKENDVNWGGWCFGVTLRSGAT